MTEQMKEVIGRIVDLTDHSPSPRVQEAHDLANELWAALNTALPVPSERERQLDGYGEGAKNARLLMDTVTISGPPAVVAHFRKHVEIAFDAALNTAPERGRELLGAIASAHQRIRERPSASGLYPAACACTYCEDFRALSPVQATHE